MGRQVSSVVRCLDATNSGAVHDVPVLLDYADPGAGRGVVGGHPAPGRGRPEYAHDQREMSDRAIRGRRGGKSRRLLLTISRINVSFLAGFGEPLWVSRRVRMSGVAAHLWAAVRPSGNPFDSRPRRNQYRTEAAGGEPHWHIQNQRRLLGFHSRAHSRSDRRNSSTTCTSTHA
jgi:hypothetical protein